MDYATMGGDITQPIDMDCGLSGGTAPQDTARWAMSLVCPAGHVWNDTRLPLRLHTCSCNGNGWPEADHTVSCVADSTAALWQPGMEFNVSLATQFDNITKLSDCKERCTEPSCSALVYVPTQQQCYVLQCYMKTELSFVSEYNAASTHYPIYVELCQDCQSCPEAETTEAVATTAMVTTASMELTTDYSTTTPAESSAAILETTSVELTSEDPTTMSTISTTAFQNSLSQKRDLADAVFVPDVNLTNKPWFTVDEEKPTVTIEARKNLTRVVANISDSVRHAMGQSIDEMLTECRWQGKPCTARNFRPWLDPLYGNCYTFTFGQDGINNTVVQAGPDYGLSLLLFIEQDEYVAALSPSDGVRLVIHANDHEPFPEDQGVDLSPGTLSQVKIRMVDEIRYEPYRNCTWKPQPTFYSSYSVRACMKTCRQRATMSRCGCADPALPTAPPNSTQSAAVNMCAETDDACVNEVEDLVAQKIIECICPELCQEQIYTANVIQAKWPCESHMATVEQQLMSQNGEFDSIIKSGLLRKNFLKLHIYYGEVKFEKAVEYPAYMLPRLVSDVGGVVGLWIGLSAISLFEMVQVLVHVFLVLVGWVRPGDRTAERDKSDGQTAPRDDTGDIEEPQPSTSYDVGARDLCVIEDVEDDDEEIEMDSFVMFVERKNEKDASNLTVVVHRTRSN